MPGLPCVEPTLRSMEGWRRSSHALRKERPAHAVQGGSRGGVRHKRGPGERLLDPSCELEVCSLCTYHFGSAGCCRLL